MTKHTKRLGRIAAETGFSKEFIEEAAEYELQIKTPGGKSTIHTIKTVHGVYRRITIYALIAAHWVKKYVQISLQTFSEDEIIFFKDMAVFEAKRGTGNIRNTVTRLSYCWGRGLGFLNSAA